MNVPRIRICSAVQGFAWIQSGLRLFARQPMLLIVLVAFGPMFVMLIGLIPIAGTAFALILVPTVNAGMLTVCRAIDSGTVPSIGAYSDAWKNPRTRLSLVQLGVYYALAFGLLAILANSVSWDMSAHAAPAVAAADAAPSAPPDAASGVATPAATAHNLVLMLGFLLAIVPLQMSVWFSPVLVAWYELPAAKAAFFSFFACWRNRWAMITYLAALAACIFLLVLAFGALISAIGITPSIALYVLAPLPLLTLAISQTSTLVMVKAVIDDSPV